jgi:hypothetical protein
MKKTLHGKRYIKSRSSVGVGRMNRKIKKLTRQMNILAKTLKSIYFDVAFKMGNALLEFNKVLRKIQVSTNPFGEENSENN